MDFIPKSQLFPGLRHRTRHSRTITEVEPYGIAILHFVSQLIHWPVDKCWQSKLRSLCTLVIVRDPGSEVAGPVK